MVASTLCNVASMLFQCHPLKLNQHCARFKTWFDFVSFLTLDKRDCNVETAINVEMLTGVIAASLEQISATHCDYEGKN